MKTLLPKLIKEYKEFNNSRIDPYSKRFFQKKVTDKVGVKYFIQCSVYEKEGKDCFEFDSQFRDGERSININTVSRFGDPEEKWRKYPTLKSVEDMFEKMWLAYGGEYYERLYTITIEEPTITYR